MADEKIAPTAPTPPSTPVRKEPGEEKPAASAQDPMRELLDRLNQMRSIVEGNNSELAQRIGKLVEQGQVEDRRNDPAFRHRAAYALEDVEKATGMQFAMAPAFRAEMTRLAGSAPGLTNENMLALMRETPSIADQALVRSIRSVGTSIGQQSTQDDSDVRSRIDNLENKMRLAERPQAGSATNPVETPATAATAAAAANQTPNASSSARDDGQRPLNGGSSGRPAADAAAFTADPANGSTGQGQAARGIFDTLLSGFRGKGNDANGSWNPPPTPMAERLAAFEATITAERDGRQFQRTIKSGQAALSALQGFTNNEGAAIMSRIQQAASTEPGGMASVLSEMREGGKFADLRQQFNVALDKDVGAAGAYDRAAAALTQYGRDRSNTQDIIARRPDAAALVKQFETVDAELGKAASETPSRADGKSMIEDLARKAAELLERAVNAVKAAFSSSPSATATANSPSPGL